MNQKFSADAERPMHLKKRGVRHTLFPPADNIVVAEQHKRIIG